MSEQDIVQTTSPSPSAGVTVKRPSWHWPLVLLGASALVGVGYAFDCWFVGRHHVETDDAYVSGNLVRLAPQVSGTVVSINADATQFVEKGQLLVQLDPRDAEIALNRAKANLGETVREVAVWFDNVHRDEATVGAQEALLARSTQDLTRDRSLAPVHGVSLETLQHDEQAVRSSQAALAQAEAILAATRTAVADTTMETHPRVLEAEANLRAAWLAYARTRVFAPVSGYIVRRTVQLGQQVATGSDMLAIVPVDSVWIDANFKETQLANLRIGQPVIVHADMYGSVFEYHGKVLGVTAGTGSALSVLPAQNASGNWIKIVQRLPVRVGLDPKELLAHPLLLGVSTRIGIDTRDRSGTALSKQPTWQSAMSTNAYATQDAGVDESIAAIVSHNFSVVRPKPGHEHSRILRGDRPPVAETIGTVRE